MKNSIINGLAVFGAALTAVTLISCLMRLTATDISGRQLTGEIIEPVTITTAAPMTEPETIRLTFETSAAPIEASEPADEPEELSELPALPSNVKLFTDYRAYNLKNTPQYRLQQVSYTDENGLRRYGEDYHVGVGSFYFTRIGGRYEVTLDTGNVITVIIADMKADCDTDELNMYTPCYNYSGEYTANILEFVVDKAVLPKSVYGYGSVDLIGFLKGNITKMRYIGEADF